MPPCSCLLVTLVGLALSNAVLVVDLRRRPSWADWDPREDRGFTDWSVSQQHCDDPGKAKPPPRRPVERLGADANLKASIVSCMTKRHEAACASIGGDCIKADTPEGAISKRAHDYFENPPPREEVFRHYRMVQTATAKFRGVRTHSYGSHNGPWLENHFIRRFWSKPFDYWYPLIPIFVQLTDSVLHGKLTKHSRMMEELFSGRPFDEQAEFSLDHEKLKDGPALDEDGKPMIETDWEDEGDEDDPLNGSVRNEDYWDPKRQPADPVQLQRRFGGLNFTTPLKERYFTPGRSLLDDRFLYVIVVQHDVGPLAAVMNPKVWRNAFVFSAGGWGNVPLPLLTTGSCVQPRFDASPAGKPLDANGMIRRSHLLSFAGRVDYQSILSGITGVLRIWRQDVMAQMAQKSCFLYPSGAVGSEQGRLGAPEQDGDSDSQLPLPLFMRESAATLALTTNGAGRALSESEEVVAKLLATTNRALLPASDTSSATSTAMMRCGLHVQPWRKNEEWKRIARESILSIALRGVGATSFRMYETLGFGRIPLYLWQYLTWLPYANSKQPLWGTDGIAFVIASDAVETFVERDLPRLLAPIEDVLALQRALDKGNLTIADAETTSHPEVLAAYSAIASLREHVQNATASSFALHPRSVLSLMEQRLQLLHDRYFTYDAVLDHIEEYLHRPQESELGCLPKPHVLTDKRSIRKKGSGRK
jgi:hypothetical protein